MASLSETIAPKESAPSAASPIAIEPRDAAEPDHALQVAQLLGDPQADVGRAADQGRVGKARIERGEQIEARRGGEEGLLVADEHVLLAGKRGERGGALPRRRGEAVGGLAAQVSSAAAMIGR